MSQKPIGRAVPQWSTRSWPPRTAMHGQWARLEPLDAERHAADLFAANSLDAANDMWTYLAVGPFASPDSYQDWLRDMQTQSDPLFFTIVDAHSETAVGLASYLRIDPANGVIEVGNLQFSPRLQRTAVATEALYLMMRRALTELRYRRCEWKCDTLNAPSLAAAQRLGFVYEGTFRQAIVYKGRNRDTAWFSILDREWPTIEAAFRRWLSADNFDAQGQQRVRLSTLTAAARDALRTGAAGSTSTP